MTTCLKEDVRSSVLDQECTSAVSVLVDPVSVNGLLLPVVALEPVKSRRRSVREAAIIALATVGLVLVPSVQSLGVSVDPVSATTSGKQVASPMETMSHATVSHEVAALVARD